MDTTQHHTTTPSRATVTHIKNHGPMRDFPSQSLWTANVQLLQSRPAVAVSLAPRTGETPDAEAFHAALLHDIIAAGVPKPLSIPAARKICEATMNDFNQQLREHSAA